MRGPASLVVVGLSPAGAGDGVLQVVDMRDTAIVGRPQFRHRARSRVLPGPLERRHSEPLGSHRDRPKQFWVIVVAMPTAK
jgi:hypothetical protein